MSCPRHGQLIEDRVWRPPIGLDPFLVKFKCTGCKYAEYVVRRDRARREEIDRREFEPRRDRPAVSDVRPG